MRHCRIFFGKYGFRSVALKEERNAPIMSSSDTMKYYTFGRREKMNNLDETTQL
jgi:hypothetical protein